MGDYKFSIVAEIVSLDDDPIPVADDLRSIFGSYAYPLHLDSMESDDIDDSVESGVFEIRTEYVPAKEHLANLSRWRAGLKLLRRAHWEGGVYMWVLIPMERDMYTKLRDFYDYYGREMRYSSDLGEDEFEVGFMGGTARIEFDGLSTSNIDASIRELKMRVLIVDAILRYCASRSRDELSEETWDDFIRSIRNRELLSYLGS
jgi:hypothetical protein